VTAKLSISQQQSARFDLLPSRLRITVGSGTAATPRYLAASGL